MAKKARPAIEHIPRLWEQVRTRWGDLTRGQYRGIASVRSRYLSCEGCGSTIDAFQQSLDLEDMRGMCDECLEMGSAMKHEPRYLPRTSSRFVKDWTESLYKADS
jgi:hypothetical protein